MPAGSRNNCRLPQPKPGRGRCCSLYRCSCETMYKLCCTFPYCLQDEQPSGVRRGYWDVCRPILCRHCGTQRPELHVSTWHQPALTAQWQQTTAALLQTCTTV